MTKNANKRVSRTRSLAEDVITLLLGGRFQAYRAFSGLAKSDKADFKAKLAHLIKTRGRDRVIAAACIISVPKGGRPKKKPMAIWDDLKWAARYDEKFAEYREAGSKIRKARNDAARYLAQKKYNVSEATVDKQFIADKISPLLRRVRQYRKRRAARYSEDR